jgi:hypothetical protein
VPSNPTRITESLLIIRLEDVMVQKPWYIKKTVRSIFVRQNNRSVARGRDGSRPMVRKKIGRIASYVKYFGTVR